MSSAKTLTFAHSPIDRSSHLRTDKAFLAEARKSANAKIAVLWNLKPFLLPGGRGIGWITWPALEALNLTEPQIVFLGLDNGDPCFAIDISSASEPEKSGPLAGLGTFLELRAALPSIPSGDAGMLGHAKSMIDWHARHGFCAQCGAQTQSTNAGDRRDCPACRSQHFPRTDPVVIMLATLGERALLGRPARVNVPFYTALAGFLEPGETIEQAVAREVHEETGVNVTNVRYSMCQPWPFPSSLMIGCYAEATSEDIKIDPVEIADARWFTRAELRDAVNRHVDFERILAGGPDEANPPLRVPPPFAIAHHLIRGFVEGE